MKILKFIFGLIGAGMVLSSCNLSVGVKETVRDEKVQFTAASSSHCYNSIRLYWKNPESENLSVVKLKYKNQYEVFEDAVSGQEMNFTVENVDSKEEQWFLLEAYDSSEKLLANTIISGHTGHTATTGTAEKDYYAGKSIVNSISYVSSANQNGAVWSSAGIVEIVVVAPGTKVSVKMEDDCSYKSYLEGEVYPSELTGVFTETSEITMKPYAMTKYEITRNDLELVSNSGAVFNRLTPDSSAPATGMTVLEAIKFANDLTVKTLGKEYCCYYADCDYTKIYSSTSNPVFYYKSDAKGYRLPSRAEWEFAARGGNPDNEEWSNAFSGFNVCDENKIDCSAYPDEESTDSNLQSVINSKLCTQSSGKHSKNSLGLIDMTGNAGEFTLDVREYYYTEETSARTSMCVLEDFLYYSIGESGGTYGTAAPVYKYLNSYSVLLANLYHNNVNSEDTAAAVKGSADSKRGLRLVRFL